MRWSEKIKSDISIRRRIMIMTNPKNAIIDEYLPVLIRESLDDKGEHKCVNYSPDIVVQKFKLDNPVADLRKSYNSDISQDNDGSGKMYIYVRFINNSNQPLKGFYIHLYRNHFGLCNVPGDWAPYEMKTEDNKPAYIEQLNSGEIGATPAFIYDSKQLGVHPNCFVAVATREKNPDYSSINTYEKYVKWINKINVAARNVCVKPRPTIKYEEIHHFRNPSKESAKMMGFSLQIINGSASGISYGMKEENLGIDESKTYNSGVNDSDYIFHIVRLSAGYSGSLRVWYETLGNAYVDMEVNFWDLSMEMSSSLLDQYGIDLGEKFDNLAEMSMSALKPRRAILLGGCRLRKKT